MDWRHSEWVSEAKAKDRVTELSPQSSLKKAPVGWRVSCDLSERGRLNVGSSQEVFSRGEVKIVNHHVKMIGEDTDYCVYWRGSFDRVEALRICLPCLRRWLDFDSHEPIQPFGSSMMGYKTRAMNRSEQSGPSYSRRQSLIASRFPDLPTPS